MAEQCTKCGSELFAGQRFCRSCGASTDDLSEEQVPTRMMPPQAADWGTRSGPNTAPTYRPDTNPVYAPPTGYQPSVPPMSPQLIPPYMPPRSRSRIGWILAALGIGLFAAVVIGVMMMARIGRRTLNEIGASQGSVARSDESTLSEANAEQVVNTGTESTLVKTFPLDVDARFSIKNINGSITVSTWDQPKAQVTVIKRASDRNSQVFFTNTNSRSLSIRTATTRGGQEVKYELKLPRQMGRVDIDSTNGSIRISDVNAEISVKGVNGSIDLIGVAGVSKVENVNGTIRTMLREASDHTMEFNNVNGNIELIISGDFDADLEASTARGSINLDDQFGIQVQREMIGQRAKGEIGSGGSRLKLSTLNGSIKISK